MDIPRGGVYVVLGEMQSLLTAMKRNNKWSSSNHQDDSHDLLIRSFSDLREVLNHIGDLQELEPNHFLNPFLDVIRSEETTGPVTSLALSAVNKFLSYSLIDRNTEHLAVTVNNIANAVMHAKFVGTDQANDAVVLMKILQVLKTLMLSTSGILLTNKVVCDITLSFFRISFESRLNELLRRFAENTLKEIVQLLFTRLPTFSEDPKRSFNSKKLKMRTGSLDSDKKYKSKSFGKYKSKKKENNEANSSKIGKSGIGSEGLNLKSSGKVLDMQGVIMNSPTSDVERPVTSCEEEKPTTAEEVGGEVPVETKTENPVGTRDIIIMIEDSLSEPKVEEEEVLKVDPGSNPLESVSQVEANDVVVPQTVETSTEISKEVKVELSQEKERVNQQGVRFTTSITDPLDDRDEPYGLTCVVELTNMLVSMVHPSDKQNSEPMMQTGLALATVALEVGADAIARFPSLLRLVSDDLSRSLFSLLSYERVSLFGANIQVCFLLFESLRTHLKFQFQLFLSKLMEIIQTDPPKVSYEMKEISLEIVVQLWRIPGLVTELYLNYDCDLYAPNLYEDLSNMLSKNAYPLGGVNNTHLLSLDALLIVIDSIEAHCHSRILNERQQSDLHSDGKKTEVPLETQPNGVLRQGCRQASTDVPSHEQIMAIKTKKKLVSTGTEHFNAKAKRGVTFLQERGLLSSPVDPAELAAFLRENPHLDKRAIGEFISSRNNLDVLDAFVRSFEFKNTRIDEALRLYLESFRLPGESPLISLVLEHFAEHWHKSNNEPFANADAAFTLAYAVIMLNVDQHNHNVRKQNVPMTCEDFKKNLKDVNGGANFDEQLLDDIYESIKSSEIVMPAEQTGAVRENYIWRMMLRRGAGRDGIYVHAPPGLFDHSLFSVAWSPTVAALCALYDKTSDTALCQKCISGFRKCAMISAHYGMHNNLDNLIVSLCKFTNLLSSMEVNNDPDETPENITIMFGANAKARLAVKAVFSLAYRHGDVVRESWRNILDCLLQLYKCKLLPKILIEAEDFIEISGKISLMREDLMSQMNQKAEPGLLSSLYSYIAQAAETNSKGPSAEEQEAIKLAQNCVRECHLEQLVTESKFLRFDSLQNFIKSLIRASYGPEGHISLGSSSYSEGTAVFFLELLLKVVITNRERVGELWPKIKEHLYTLMMGAAACNHQFLVERCVVGLLRLAIRLMRKEEMSPTVLQSLRMLLLLKSLGRVARHVAYGMLELLRTSAANIHAAADWAIIFTLLECVGAGAPPPRVVSKSAALHAGAKSEGESNEERQSPDRGYTSDSEINRVNGSGAATPDLLQPTGWIMVGKEGEIQPVTGAGGRVPPPDLDKELGPHDPAALVRCCDALSFLVRDVAHITPYNFDNCVHCILTFVQATLNQNEKKTTSKKNKESVKNKRRFRGKKEQETLAYDADESDAEEIPNGYTQVCIQLLDVMHTLHTRTAQIYRWWAEEDGGVAEHMSPWRDGWCPLLQGIAALCSHPDRQVRMSAITYLQRALLVSDLAALSGAEWESCFTRVLFPLLGKVLQPGLDAPDETRIRVSTVLSKVFLHHLTPLQSLPSFLELWMTILDFMDKYMHADNSDLLLEAVPESLKNMLLVMDSAEMFTNADGNRNELWALTWDRISSFLPGLQLDLFRPATTEVPSVDVELKPSEQKEEIPVSESLPIEKINSSEQPPFASSPESRGIITASLVSSSPETWQPPPSMFPHLGQVLSTPAAEAVICVQSPPGSEGVVHCPSDQELALDHLSQSQVATSCESSNSSGQTSIPVQSAQPPVPGHSAPLTSNVQQPLASHAPLFSSQSPVPGHATALPVYSGFSNMAPHPSVSPTAHFFYQDNIPQPGGSSQPCENAGSIIAESSGLINSPGVTQHSIVTSSESAS